MWYSQSYTASAAGFLNETLALVDDIFTAVMGQNLLLVFMVAMLVAVVFGFYFKLIKESKRL